MADIDLKVSMDTKAAAASANALDEALKKMGATGDIGKQVFSGLWKEVFAGITVANLAGKAVRGFVDFIKDSITAAAESEKIEGALKSALATTGREAIANTKHFIDYAASLQKTTIYDDEAIKGAQTLLIQLTSLNREGIDRATKGAIGLASVLGIDLQSAAMMVAKAMEGNTGALGRYGIKVRETGTIEEKRNELLGKLDVMYQRATDATGTFAGKTAQLKNNLDEFRETVGKTIIENERLQKVTADLSLGFQYLAEHGGALKTVVDGVFQGLLGPGGMLLLKLLGGLADKQRELNKEAEAGAKWGDKFKDSLLKMKPAGDPVVDFLISLARIIHEVETGGGILRTGLDALREKAKAAGVTIKDDLEKKLIALRDTLRALNLAGQSTPAIIEDLRKKITDLDTAIHPERFNKLAFEIKDTGEVASSTADVGAYKLLGSLQKLYTGNKNATDSFGLLTAAQVKNRAEFERLHAAHDKALKVGETAIVKWAKKHKDQIEMVLAFAQQAFGLLSAVQNNYYVNQMNNIEKTYKKDKERIERSYTSERNQREQLKTLDKDYQNNKDAIENSALLSEAERKAQLTALDAKYEADKEALQDKFYDEEEKKKEELKILDAVYEQNKLAAQREAANKQKGVAIAMAIINTAEAVTKALTGAIPPFNFILAALSMAMGIAQIAIIKGTPLPLAKGAMFDRPTLLAGGRYEIGEAGKEVAMPVEPFFGRLEAMISKALAAKGGGQTLVQVFIGQEELDKRMVRVVNRQADLRRFKIASGNIT